MQESFDPASEWEDNIWPIRQHTPWDISTDFAYPRTLQYDVQEGTWLRLDVHPISGDIVFDMIGDLYCLPGRLALRSSNRDADVPIKALPILTGIPFDSDPRFSRNGDRLVFRSDAELGVENIWVMEWTGCEDMVLKRKHATDLQLALDNTRLSASSVPEDTQRKRNRLMREGRLEGSLEYHLSPFTWSLKSASQLIALQMKHIDGLAMLVFIPLVQQWSPQSGIPLDVLLVRVKDGCTPYPL